MGAAAPPAMAVMSIAGKGMEIAGGVAQGIQNKAAGQVEAIKLKMAAEAGKVRAIQTDAAYREDLNNTLQNIGAIRSSQSVGFDSPTSFAIYDKARDLSDRARVVAVSNERLKALGLDGDAAAAWRRGEMARTTATLGQAKNILSFGQEVAGFMK